MKQQYPLSETSSKADSNESSESDDEYPFINLKDGLHTDMQEKRLKDIERYAEAKKGLRFKRTEFSREVVGRNKMMNLQMSKGVNYIFSEFDCIRDKMKRFQQKEIEKLHEIHLDKRKQMRETYKYHNEENRYTMQRIKDEEKFNLEQAELEEMMRRRERSIVKLSNERREIMKEMNLKGNEKMIKRRKEAIVEEIPKQQDDKIEHPDDREKTSRSHSFLLAGALEVSKNNDDNPNIIKRKMDFIKYHEKSSLTPSLDTNYYRKNAEISIDIRNNDKDLKPAIDLSQTKEHENTINKDAQAQKSSKEIIQEIKNRKAQKMKEILSLPYNIYRRNNKGKLEKVEHRMVKNEFKEFSNKDKYKRRKGLDTEREKYQDYISQLAEKTEMIIQEDIKIKKKLNAPQMKAVKEAVVAPQRIVGPKDWMKAFVSSNLPVGMDPSSTDAIIYCQYIRAPLHKYEKLPNYELYHH